MPNTQSTGIAYADPEFTTCFASEQIGYSTAAQGVVTLRNLTSGSLSEAVVINFAIIHGQ